MNIISVRDCAYYGKQAGFTGTDLIIMTAICGAESGYNTDAHALTSREDSRGLAQINVWAHPWGKSQNLYNGQVNLNAAMRVYREARNRFTPWSTYLHGTYQPYMNAARIAVGEVFSGGPPPEQGYYGPAPSAVPDDYSSQVAKMTGRFTGSARTIIGMARTVSQIPR